jgi:hypothetical protein
VVTQTARYRRLRRAGRAFVVGLAAGDVLVDTVGWRARQLGAAIGVAVVASVVTLEADSPRGYRLVLMCFTGMAIVAAFLSLALPGRRPVAREPAPAPASHHST